MGQYYKPILLNKENNKIDIIGYLTSRDLGIGAKLMEHSYFDNPLINSVLNKLKEIPGGARLVWAGDYADSVITKNGNITWLEDEKHKNKNLYEKADSKVFKKFEPNTNSPEITCILNKTKHLYISQWDIPYIGSYAVHPLPILCADGNGRGGGDYEGINMDLVGSWKNDVISVTELNPYQIERDGYEKFDSIFAESYQILEMIKLTEKVKEFALSQGIVTKDEIKKLKV